MNPIKTGALFLFIIFFILILLPAAYSQQMDFEEYNPPSTLVVPAHNLTRSKFPFIDAHNHQWRSGSGDLSGLIAEMDQLNMKVMVNLSGRSGAELKSMVDNTTSQYPGRFIVFANIDFNGIGTAGWAEKVTRQLEADVSNGAKGLKIFKNLGMSVKDADGKRVPVNDPRIDPVWEKCAQLKIPVLIHTADPKPFWQPHDKQNERWLELKEVPNRKRSDTDPAPWEQIIEEQHALFKKHAKTIFINAHLGWLGNDLGKLGRLMDECPNMYTEIGAVLAEIGRQPRFAREFFTKYQDRILFGKDSWHPEEYHAYFRVLETNDEYFDYYRRRHAFWKIYGMGLPDEILKKVYYKNALRIIPGIDRSAFPD
ncbi:MAG TPA: amidohydrolase family protein [Cyclobacteriaceae bacterium]|nr:amidohydrolase family protein [Cyclobacteriaceae bacterium]